MAALAAVIVSFCASAARADYVIGAGETYVMAAGETLTIDGNLTIAATGTLDASAAGVTINVSGNWSNSGTFTPGTGSTVVLNGTAQQNILGTTTFYNLTTTTATARTIGFEEDKTQTINGAATFTGASGQLLSMRTVNSSGTVLNDGSQATIDFKGTASTDYLDVRDHIATSSNAAVSLSINPTNSNNSGNTSGWFGNADLKTLMSVSDVNGGTLAVGDTLTYTITVQNIGGSNSLNTILMQIIPPGTTYVADSTTLNGSAAADVSGTSPLVNGLTINTPSQPAGKLTINGTETEVTFQVTVNSGIPTGSSITAQATAHSDEVVNDFSDDPSVDGNGDSDFENDTDVTTAVVGTAPILQSTMTVVDVNGGSLAVGDTLRYTVVVTNVGNASASSVSFADVIPTNTTYTPGTILFNGAARTDASGDDNSDFNISAANTVTVDVGTLSASGGQATVKFDVTLNVGTANGTVISAQGTIDSSGTPALSTDADGNSANGYQATTIVVGNNPSLSAVMTVTDLDGGDIEPGDTLRYSVMVTNIGGSNATTVVLQDAIPANLTYTSGTIRLDTVTKTDASDADAADYGATLAGAVTVNFGTIASGDQHLVTFDVTVDGAASNGTSITNTSNLTSGNASATSGSKTIYVGGTPGKGKMGGTIYVDKDFDNVVDSGEALVGWTIKIKTCASGEPVATPVYETTTDSSGVYSLSNLPSPESYTVQIYDTNGTFYGDIEPGVCRSVADGDNVVGYNLDIDPSGYVYDAVTGNPVSGVTVEFLDVSGGHGGGAGALVPNADLVGSNTVTTDASGFYSFVFKGGSIPAAGNLYQLRVTAPTGYITSIAHPVVTSSTAAGLLDISSSEIDAPAAGNGIVDDEAAAPFNVSGAQGAQYRYAYYVRYAAGETGEVFQNNIPLDPSDAAFIRLTKVANKKEAEVGSIITYTVTMQNVSSSALSDVVISDIIPGGFKYLADRAILDGSPISDPTGTRTLTFNIGSLAVGASRVLKYQLIIGSGVTFGKYENTALAKTIYGTALSNRATATVRVVPDALFDLGTVIGKVFVDGNGNGVQDRGEKPVPRAQLMTEEGTAITTDDFGRYHIPGVIPGRHVLRLIESSLPDGSELTTKKAVIIDVTQGLPIKVNFGVRLPDGAKAVNVPFFVTQDTEAPELRLNTSLFNMPLVVGDVQLREPARFRIFTNYHLFIEAWRLQITDVETQHVIWEFSGNRDNIFHELVWEGRDLLGDLIKPSHHYQYQLIVDGKGGRRDTTEFKPIDVIVDDGIQLSKADQERKDKEELDAYRKWVESESAINTLSSQQIVVQGQMVKIASAYGSNVSKVRLMKGEKFVDDIPLNIVEGLTAQYLLDHPGVVEKPQGAPTYTQGTVDLVLPNGDYTVTSSGDSRGVSMAGSASSASMASVSSDSTVAANTSLGQAPGDQRPTDYSKQIKVGDDYMLFVAMGDAKVGYNTSKGDIEPINKSDNYQDGFWREGKLAYYLKGKVKGKYLITSSLDTDRRRKELFRSLDPNKYYPVYGDDGSVSTNDANTQGNLYVMVEWDKSMATWGNFNTDLTDTKLAQFNRGLYGGKVYIETVETNEHGDAKTKVVAFTAKAQQKGAHNEFLGTGGSLFYLKHQHVVEGSQSVRLEIRDAVTGLVLTTKPMEEPFDYSVDHSSGRITFSKPVSMAAGSDLIVSTQLLEGNPVFVVVDYSYEVIDPFDQSTVGLRAQEAVGDYGVIGGTYVQENQERTDYQLQGVDTKVYVGDTTVVKAEYAESESQTGSNYVSTDGGLTFTELASTDNSNGRAYAASTESYLLSHALGVKTRYQLIDHDFSTQSTASEQGKELIGFETTYDFDKTLRMSLIHDIQRLLQGGNALTASQVGATRTQTTTLQVSKELDRITATGEYRHQEIAQSTSSESESGLEGDYVAGRIDYELKKGFDAYFEQQFSFNTDVDNHQTTVGLTADINQYVQLRAEQKVGSQGTATTLGTTAKFFNKLTLSGDYTLLTSPDGVRSTTFGVGSGVANRSEDDKFNVASTVDRRSDNGRVTDVSTISGSYQADENTELSGSVSMNGVSTGEKMTSTTFGTKRKINDALSLTNSKTYTEAGSNKITANNYGFTREVDNRTISGQLTNQMSQSDTNYVTSSIGSITGDINQDWAAGLSFERGLVHNLDNSVDKRNAGGVQFSYLRKDLRTGQDRLKWVNKLELRLDDGAEDRRQYLVQTLLEGKTNDDWTLFTKVDWSSTNNTTTGTTEAMYKELAFGFAYRPVDNDRLNMLGKYSLIEDDAPVSQTDVSDIQHERFQVLGLEGIYDFNYRWQLAQKLAFKWGEERVTGFDTTATRTWLWASRVNYRITQAWTAGFEYRYLAQAQAKDNKQGALIELSRKIGDFVDVGAGYNFTDFNDDLTHLDYTVRGPYVRVTGTLYDRTPEEKAKAREKWLDERVEAWAYTVAKQILSKSDYNNDALRTEKIQIYKNAIYQRITDERAVKDLIHRADKLRKAKRPARAALLDLTVLDKLQALKQQSSVYPSKLFQRGFLLNIDQEIKEIQERFAREALSRVAIHQQAKVRERPMPIRENPPVLMQTAKTLAYKKAIHSRVEEEREILSLLERVEELRQSGRPARASLLELTALGKLEALKEQSNLFRKGFLMDIDQKIALILQRSDHESPPSDDQTPITKQPLAIPPKDEDAIANKKRKKQKKDTYQNIYDERDIEALIKRVDEVRQKENAERAESLKMSALNESEVLKKQSIGHALKLLRNGEEIDIDREIKKIHQKKG